MANSIPKLSSMQEAKNTQHMAQEKEYVENMLSVMPVSSPPSQLQDIPSPKISHNLLRQAQQQSGLKYTPLPTDTYIRTLKLLPGPEDEPIRCSLELADLNSEDLDYSAISYAWGDLTDLKTIECDGHPTNVTRSLFEALERFRSPEEEYILWVDALCIDQQNSEEKTSQVRLMQSIYKKASYVLVFLGHENTDSVLDDLNTICRYVSKCYPNGWHDVSPRFCFEDEWVYDFGPETYKFDPVVGEVLPLTRICSTPWFGRGWVIQEVALPANALVFWGQGQIEFQWIGLAAFEVSRLIDSNLLPSGIRHCAFMQFMHEAQHGDLDFFSFFMLLVTTHDVAYSDPRDRVYGLLGMQTLECDPANGQPFVNPDYSISILDCYRVVTEKMLVELKDLRVLSNIHHGPELKDDWPSWVPVWDKHKTGGLLGIQDNIAILKNEAVVSKVNSGNRECIRINGFTVDTAHHEVAEAKDLKKCTNHLQRLRHIQALFRQLEQSHSVEAIACTFGDLQTPPPYPKRVTTFLEQYQALMQWNPPWDPDVTETYKSGFSNDIRLQNPVAVLLYRAYLRRWHARCLFESKNGMLVLGPEAMREGDVIVHLLGGVPPYVLRPVDGLWTFVGECYVYALVDGDAVQEWRESGRAVEQFDIY